MNLKIKFKKMFLSALMKNHIPKENVKKKGLSRFLFMKTFTWETFLLKNHTQNGVEKVVPYTFLENSN